MQPKPLPLETLLKNLKIQVPPVLFLKDPESSTLGHRILYRSIFLIDHLGFEEFTFRKLGQEIASAESTIYRYFENKHMLLLYLTSWYWSWLEYRVVMNTANLSDPKAKLCGALEAILAQAQPNGAYPHIDPTALQRIVIAEASKAFLTKSVDEENRNGYFNTYKQLCLRLAGIIEELSPHYPHPRSLASTLMEGILSQQFMTQHLPTLSDLEGPGMKGIGFYKSLVLATVSYGTK